MQKIQNIFENRMLKSNRIAYGYKMKLTAVTVSLKRRGDFQFFSHFSLLLSFAAKDADINC